MENVHSHFIHIWLLVVVKAWYEVPLQVLGALLPVSEIVFWSFLPYVGDMFSPILNCHTCVLAAKNTGRARVILLPEGSGGSRPKLS